MKYGIEYKYTLSGYTEVEAKNINEAKNKITSGDFETTDCEQVLSGFKTHKIIKIKI